MKLNNNSNMKKLISVDRYEKFKVQYSYNKANVNETSKSTNLI